MVEYETVNENLVFVVLTRGVLSLIKKKKRRRKKLLIGIREVAVFHYLGIFENV